MIINATEHSVSELFEINSRQRGLDLENIPTAVQLAVTALLQSIVTPFNALLAELPASARAFDWMDAAFSAFAETAARTIVIDGDGSGDGGGSTTEPGTDGDAPDTAKGDEGGDAK